MLGPRGVRSRRFVWVTGGGDDGRSVRGGRSITRAFMCVKPAVPRLSVLGRGLFGGNLSPRYGGLVSRVPNTGYLFITADSFTSTRGELSSGADIRCMVCSEISSSVVRVGW